MPGNHRVGNPGQTGYFGRNRRRRLLKLFEWWTNIANQTVGEIAERYHAELNDLVLGRIEPRRLNIHE